MYCASRRAWSVTRAFIGYRMMALMPLSPRAAARRQWSRSGTRKDSVFPDPVPVVTMVGCAAVPFVDSRRKASA